MKQNILRFLLVLGLVVAPLGPAFAGSSVTSDEDLGAVSARGFGALATPALDGQQNSFASVQLGGQAQQGASALSLYNASVSHVNIQQNIASFNGVQDLSAVATNDQEAQNSVSSAGLGPVWNTLSVQDQTNGQAAVQLDGAAQSGVKTLSLVNAASSAANVYQRLTNVSQAQNFFLPTYNSQAVSNTGYETQDIMNDGRVVNQANGNSSVQAAGSAQTSASALALANAADAAFSIFQNIAAFTNSDGVAAIQANDQDPTNTGVQQQTVANSRRVKGQVNDNASVRMAGNAQQGVHALLASNAAASIANMGQNVAYANSANNFSAEQANVQVATNTVEADQQIANARRVSYQSNGNGSVELNGQAQSSSKVLSMVNAADSALNMGQNIAAGSMATSGWNAFDQENRQTATNGEIILPGASGSATADGSQEVINAGRVSYQSNNSGSVQVTNDKQGGARSLSTTDAALSGVNVGQNVLRLNALAAGLDQSNSQTATNGTFQTQSVENSKYGEFQGNNLTSVQVSDGGQQSASSLLLTNAANSAVSAGQNIVSVNNSRTRAVQRNDQSSTAFAESDQTVANGGNVANQVNNNGSVQLASAQNNSRALSLANLADSSANIGQNVINLNTDRARIRQVNKQDAEATGTVSQTVTNDGDAAYQVNDNASVRLTGGGSQNSSSAVSLLNAAASSVNVGQNIAKAQAGEKANLLQKNYQADYLSFAADQTTATVGSASYQDNNAASLQIADSQNSARALSIANLAGSAANIGQNAADVKAVGAKIKQINVQYPGAPNITGEAIVAETNSGSVANQNNNIGSIQLSDSQDAASGLSILNSALSSANVGQNVVSVNAGKWAKVKQANVQNSGITTNFQQTTTNYEDVSQQSNNNLSVQLANAQNNARGLSLANLSSSSADIGQNVASLKSGDGIRVSQVNDQTSWPYTKAYQTVINGDNVDGQNNNNASVQLTDSQNGTHALSLLNLAGSAANVGQNIASVQANWAKVDQINKQTATATGWAEQLVNGFDEAQNQVSNNGAVQLAGSQNNVSALSIVNASLSSVNIGQNILRATGQDVSVDQVNCQTASNSTVAYQSNIGPGAATSQSNNFSVVLDNSQMNTHALVIANLAGASVNFGQNIACINGARGVSLTQVNIQRAY